MIRRLTRRADDSRPSRARRRRFQMTPEVMAKLQETLSPDNDAELRAQPDEREDPSASS
jgi:hypothetical protein